MTTAYTGVKLDGSAFAAATARTPVVNPRPIFGKLVMTTSFITGDTIVLCPIPAGVSIRAVEIDFPALDTGTGITVEVGDNAQSYVTTGQADRIIAASAITTAKFLNMGANGKPGSLGRKYTTADSLILTVVTGPQTGVTTGTITYVVDYTIDP